MPNFEKIWEKYPRGSIDEVKKKIGGNVNADWIENSCAIRLSYTLNRAGHNILQDGNETISGYMSDDEKKQHKKWHYYRFEKIEEYVKHHIEDFGEKIEIASREQIAAAIKDKKGILFFHMPGQKTFTGHAALWNMNTFAKNEDDHLNDDRVKSAIFIKMG